ncbi:MAG: hypothetical protein ACT4OS_11565 [Acidimicrobiales bacterium]
MALSFRNIDFDEDTSLDTWPAEAIEILIDRGALSDWRRLVVALEADPWGPLAQTVEDMISLDSHHGVDRILEHVLRQHRIKVISMATEVAGRRPGA